MNSFWSTAIHRLAFTFLAAVALVAASIPAARAQTCGTTTWDLTAGQTIKVGTVTVSNDTANLYVTYALDTATYPTATFGTLHLWAGNDILTVPSNRQGILNPGHFPHQFDTAGGTSHTFAIPFADLAIQDVTAACGKSLFVVTHAEVDVDSNGDGVLDHETAFGGPNPGTGPRWWFYGTYQVCCDFGPPPVEKCTTAYGKGGYVWTTDRKSNPENLPSLGLTRNRWGWATNLAVPGSLTSPLWAGAGLNNTANGVLVGTVAISWDGANVTVTYNVTTGDLKEAHVYAGDAAPLTIAPGQYGHTAYLGSGTTTYTVTLPAADTNGDGIWVVAHSVACY